MRIYQSCASCRGVYYLVPEQYQNALLVHCPSCAHPNPKQPPLSRHGSLTPFPATAVIMSEQQNKSLAYTVSKARCRPLRVVRPGVSDPPTLEKLRAKVENKGRVFVLGTGPSLNNHLLADIAEYDWPSIGVNDAFQKFPGLDALVLADCDYIRLKLSKIVGWQEENVGKYIFWMTETKKRARRLRWIKDEHGRHGTLIDMATNETVWAEPVEIYKALVTYYYKKPQKIVHDLTLPLNLNFQDSVIFPAINLAYLLGAKEICLLGVDLEDNSHFYRAEEKPFPKQDQILEKLVLWRQQYSEQGCRLATCNPCGPVAKRLSVIDFQEAVTPQVNFSVKRLREKIERARGKVFLFGAGESLNRVPLQNLCGWPVIGVNTAWLRYPWLDALIFGDPGFIEQYESHLLDWQRIREEKPILFWFQESERAGFSRVIPWEHALSGPIQENPEFSFRPSFSIKHSIITCAVNLAYWLGAKEIYLLGVDLEDNAHFWDTDQSIARKIGQPTGAFPGSERIVNFLLKQADYLKERGVSLAKCTPGGALEDLIDFVDLELVTDPKCLNKRFTNDPFRGE